jgi:TetR/AcrR family transcriptional regulator, regulator of cefoperazone and chloramphenicol sensitivity
MTYDASNTKEALLEAAGELFADSGLEGVSVRSISKKAHANIAAIHYHFGSKENLYLQVVRHVMMKSRCSLAGTYLLRKEEWRNEPVRCAEVVYHLVEERIRQFFPGLHPRWYGRLFMRILLNPTPALWKLAEEIIMPDFEALREVLRCCKPGMSVKESELWTDTLIGQLSHYVFSEQFLALMPDRKIYDERFLLNVLHHVSSLLIRGLELPLPKMLQKGETYA